MAGVWGGYSIWLHYQRERLLDWQRGEGGRDVHAAGIHLGVDGYDAAYYQRPLARAYLNHPRRAVNLVDMIEYLRPRRVFEFGAGLGHVARESRRRGIDLVGSETSAYALANSLCPEAMVRIEEIPKSPLPFADNSFDLAFSSEVLEHVSEAATQPVLQELHRVAGGSALLTINLANLQEPGHVNLHPRAWWLEQFARAGFVHDDAVWRKLERMKWLEWELFVFTGKATDDAG